MLQSTNSEEKQSDAIAVMSGGSSGGVGASGSFYSFLNLFSVVYYIIEEIISLQ